MTTRQQTNDPCPLRPAAAAQIGVATCLIALQPTSVQLGGYARLSQEQDQSRKVMLRLGGIYRIEYERL